MYSTATAKKLSSTTAVTLFTKNKLPCTSRDRIRTTSPRYYSITAAAHREIILSETPLPAVGEYCILGVLYAYNGRAVSPCPGRTPPSCFLPPLRPSHVQQPSRSRRSSAKWRSFRYIPEMRGAPISVTPPPIAVLPSTFGAFRLIVLAADVETHYVNTSTSSNNVYVVKAKRTTLPRLRALLGGL